MKNLSFVSFLFISSAFPLMSSAASCPQMGKNMRAYEQTVDSHTLLIASTRHQLNGFVFHAAAPPV